MAAPNYSEIVATTLEERSGEVADNVTKNNALLMKLDERGNNKPFSGGRVIAEELSYAENSGVMSYSGYDTLSIETNPVLTAAEYALKQYAAPVSMSGLEQLQNAGDAQVIDLLESRIEIAEASLMNRLAADIYGDGTGNGGRNVGGLQLLLADVNNTGVVGGIDRSLWPFWRHFVFNGVADGGAAVSSANIVSYMNRVMIACTRSADRPNLIVADGNYYRYYLESQQANVRRVDTKLMDAGFDNVMFGNVPVVLDGGIGGGCPANHMYFANTKYLRWRPHASRNFTKLPGGQRFSLNQDAFVQFMAWAGNLTMRGAQFQGVLKG